MKKLLVLLLIFSPPVMASDFGIGFLAFLSVMTIVKVWPLLLPLFYLRGVAKSIKLYFALALTCFGLLGLVQAPFSIYSSLESIWGDTSASDTYSNLIMYSMHILNLLALAVSLWLLPKLKIIMGNRSASP